ncbi:MAG: phosphoesterase [Planctomycetes bacterium]|nr:phosphoesterase [Planctomycetota bacterium]
MKNKDIDGVLPFLLFLSSNLFILLLFLVTGTGISIADVKCETAGPQKSSRIILPINQVLTPAGKQVELPGLRPQVISLSPDGKLLVTSGKTAELVVLEPSSGKILQRVPLPPEPVGDSKPEDASSAILKPDKKGQVSYTGLTFSPDGSRIYLSNVNGSIKVFAVDSKHQIEPLYSISLPAANIQKRTQALPAGLAISADGKRLYVTLNVSNRLLELDLETRKPLRMFDTGTAPYAVVLAAGKAYVTNWGGSRPNDSSVTAPIGLTGKVKVDSVRFIANEGSVSIIDLKSGKLKTEIVIGLHASGITTTGDQQYVMVANAASDTVSVIETSSDKIIETINMNWGDGDLFGATPNAVVYDNKECMLYVCNGSQNAIAVVSFKPGKSQLLGLVPTAWFPGAIEFDMRKNTLYVANIKGIGSFKRYQTQEKHSYSSHQYFGTVSLIKVPDKTKLAEYTQAVLHNNYQALAKAAMLPARTNQPARPVPHRIGEPSVFNHVMYIIKENRTYDQVLGDMKQGNGDPNLCVFGEEVTPNQHKICREFVLLDNTYCAGICSADGHQWSDSAITTDYMEKSFAGFPRSYPDGMEWADVDALAYSPAGFIWDNAIAHNISLRIYGEFTVGNVRWKDSKQTHKPSFLDIYNDMINKTGLIAITSTPAIESLKPYINMQTIGWDMAVPDIFRAEQFIKELHQFEDAGEMPRLMIICLPNDHTSGTMAGRPTPAAQVADNDLALGQIVEAISHSRFWKESCIFVIEDDPQAGWDHVSGYRTTAYVVSPYTRRGAVVNKKYDQPGLLRTIELILGLPPMNQIDASAVPMAACFTDTPDWKPYTAVPNTIPLDQMNPAPEAITEPIQRSFAFASATLDLDQIDNCPEDLFNRIIWNAQKGSEAPYPAWAISQIDED